MVKLATHGYSFLTHGMSPKQLGASHCRQRTILQRSNGAKISHFHSSITVYILLYIYILYYIYMYIYYTSIYKIYRGFSSQPCFLTPGGHSSDTQGSGQIARTSKRDLSRASGKSELLRFLVSLWTLNEFKPYDSD